MNLWQRIVQGAQHDLAQFRAFQVGQTTGTPPLTTWRGASRSDAGTPQEQWRNHVANLSRTKIVSTAAHHLGKYRNMNP